LDAAVKIYLLDHVKGAKIHYLAHFDENSPAGRLVKS
jgi:hypothetical protein